jgi:hypothetical protein
MFDDNTDYPTAVASSLQRREKKTGGSRSGSSRSATGPVTGLDVTLHSSPSPFLTDMCHICEPSRV